MAAPRSEHAHAGTDRPATETFMPRPTHDNRMAARQTSCRQQTAPPQPRCSKDVTAHPHRPGARPGRPCPVPACSGQPPSGRSGFSSPLRNRIAYALVVLDIGSNLGAVINTKTREDPWRHLDELAGLWGQYPKAIRVDGAAEFESDGFKTWHRKHRIAFNPVETYLHTMQGNIENLVKQVKVHSRCILKHDNLPTRFWSETTTMYTAVHNLMPTDKMLVPFTTAQPH
jgi:hypothetical protein